MARRAHNHFNSGGVSKMAVGDGGFSTRAMGFDKNEVNEYISNLRKKMNEIEAEKKANDEKTEAALKQAESADERVKAAEQAGEEKAAQLQAELNAAQRGADNLNSQIESLKTQLETEKKKMTDMLRSGKGIDSEAKRAYAEVISKAEADAKVVITDAEQTAEKIVAEARQTAAATQSKVNELLEIIHTQLEAMGGGYKAIAECASDVFAANGGVFSAEIPDFSAMAGAAINKLEKEDGIIEEAPAAAPEPAPAASAAPAPMPAPEVKAEAKPEPAPAPEPEASAAEEPASTAEMDEAKPADSGLASFDDDIWGGSAVAQSIYDEAKERQGIPLLNPDRDESLKMFGAQPEENAEDPMQAMADLAASLGADLSADEPVDEVKPIDNDHHAKASFDHDFSSDLLAQTMNSTSLGEDADEDLLNAIKAQEEKFAVKPRTAMEDLDMGDEGGVADDEFDFMKTLEDAEKKLHDLGGGSVEFQPDEPKGASSPWDDMQKELDALEKSGAFNASDDIAAQPEPETPAAPSADDSSIWNFGTEAAADTSSDDDMMSSDFGGFGL